MSESLEMYDTAQPWIIYIYGRTHDGWWPPWSSTRVLGFGLIDCECSICGERETVRVRIPRFGSVPDRGKHEGRVAFLAAHAHPLQRDAPETWARPLRNLAALAGSDAMDILHDVAERATVRAGEHDG